MAGGETFPEREGACGRRKPSGMCFRGWAGLKESIPVVGLVSVKDAKKSYEIECWNGSRQ